MRDQLREVLDLQPQFSSANTPAMYRRGIIVRDEIPGWIRARLPDLRLLVPGATDDLESNGRDGAGAKTRIAWSRIFSASHAPNASEGWYVAILFAASGGAVYVSINQGSTIWRGGQLYPRPHAELAARVAWATNILANRLAERPSVTATIDLESTQRDGLARGYEVGNVAAFRYEKDSLPSTEELYSDLRFLVATLGELYLAADDLAAPGDQPPHVADAEAAATATASPTKRVRFRQSSAERDAIEKRAVAVAIQHLRGLGFEPVRDVGDKKTHDLEACKDGVEILVEVKGTTAVGSQVVLTRNEVASYNGAYPHSMIAIVSGIRLKRGVPPVAGGGIIRLIHPWKIDLDDLTPLSYEYAVPADG